MERMRGELGEEFDEEEWEIQHFVASFLLPAVEKEFSQQDGTLSLSPPPSPLTRLSTPPLTSPPPLPIFYLNFVFLQLMYRLTSTAWQSRTVYNMPLILC